MSNLVFIVANKRANSNIESVAGSKYFTDCTVDIQHEFANTVTEHPVEDGVNFSDHVQRQNNRFTVNGVFSDIPLNGYAGDSLPILERITAAYEFLKKLRDQALTFTLVSKYESYPDCVIENLSIPVTAETSASLHFSMSVVQIRRSKTATTTAILTNRVRADKVDTASSTTDSGKKNTTDVKKSVAVTGGEWTWDALFGDSEVDKTEEDIKNIEKALEAKP